MHNKGRLAWLFQNAADIMRLRPGLNHNFMVMGHAHFCQGIFQLDVNREDWAERPGKAAKAGKVIKGPLFGLPAGVVPLSNNSRKTDIIAMMPDCNVHGPVQNWAPPLEE